MSTFFSKLFDTSDYPARWTCGRWSPLEGWLHIVSDITICIAYVAIPLALFILVRKRKDIAFPFVIWLFILFILSCGITHGFEAAIFWWPAYRWTALLKVITAIVSVFTVIKLIQVMPKALTLPSLYAERETLTKTVQTSSEEKQKLVMSFAELEKRTAELVLKERRLRDAVAAARACAVAIDVQTGQIVWEMGLRQVMELLNIDESDPSKRWTRMIGAEAIHALQQKAMAAYMKNEPLRLTIPAAGMPGWDVRISATPEAGGAGSPQLLVGLIGVATRDQMMAILDSQ